MNDNHWERMLDGTMDSVMQIRPDETAASQHDDWDQVGHHETAISSSMPHGDDEWLKNGKHLLARELNELSAQVAMLGSESSKVKMSSKLLCNQVEVMGMKWNLWMERVKRLAEQSANYHTGPDMVYSARDDMEQGFDGGLASFQSLDDVHVVDDSILSRIDHLKKNVVLNESSAGGEAARQLQLPRATTTTDNFQN